MQRKVTYAFVQCRMCYLLVLLAECITEPSAFLVRFVGSAELYRVAQKE
jgi:hypothetical protein